MHGKGCQPRAHPAINLTAPITFLFAHDPIEHSLHQVQADKAAAVAILRHLPADDGPRPLVGEAALEVDVLVAHVVEALVGWDAVPMLPLAAAGEQRVAVDRAAPALVRVRIRVRVRVRARARARVRGRDRGRVRVRVRVRVHASIRSGSRSGLGVGLGLGLGLGCTPPSGQGQGSG